MVTIYSPSMGYHGDSCVVCIYIYIYINIHSYEGDIMVLFGRIYNITVRYGSHGPFNLIKTMMYRLIEC